MCEKSTVTLFADDTCILGSHKTDHKTQYQQDLRKVEVWLNHNKLTLNADKTKLIDPNNHKLEFHLGGKTIETVDYTKYLGLNIDKKLKFEEHIRTLTKRLLTNLQPLRFFKKFVSQKKMLQAYKIYILPILQYGVLSYGTANKTILLHLEKTQKMIWRIIFGIKKYESVNETRQKYRLLNVRELHLYELTKVLSKNLQKNDDTNTLSTFIQPDELLADKRTKTLKTRKQQTKDSQKLLSNRVRKLYNVLIRWDAKIIEYMKSSKQSSLSGLLHKFRDTLICDNSELTQLFW